MRKGKLIAPDDHLVAATHATRRFVFRVLRSPLPRSMLIKMDGEKRRTSNTRRSDMCVCVCVQRFISESNIYSYNKLIKLQLERFQSSRSIWSLRHCIWMGKEISSELSMTKSDNDSVLCLCLCERMCEQLRCDRFDADGVEKYVRKMLTC